ncbi:hypothetical protein K5D56_23430 [Pseudomonas cichorii]|nr:hypothetical protein [Pseudomonas cichorii]MBX8592321.1 hypothetical protein [Pseudomonas cichorii]
MKRFTVLVAFLFFFSSVQAAEECEKSIPRDAILYQQFNMGVDFACIYEAPESSDNAVLSFYSRSGDKVILLSSNKNFVSLDSVRDGTNQPDITKTESGAYQILWNYPNGVDAIELAPAKDGIYLKGATKEMRLPSFDTSEKVKSITLVSNLKNLEKLNFSDMHISEVFNKDALMLAGGEITTSVSSEKIFLYSEPSESSKTKGYLISGDEVRILEYKNGFLKISYKMKNGNYLIRWISISSVI